MRLSETAVMTPTTMAMGRMCSGIFTTFTSTIVMAACRASMSGLPGVSE